MKYPFLKMVGIDLKLIEAELFLIPFANQDLLLHALFSR